MSNFPASTVKVVGVEACGEGKVCITMQMVVDVHRMAEVSSEMMRMSVKQMKNTDAKKKK